MKVNLPPSTYPVHENMPTGGNYSTIQLHQDLGSEGSWIAQTSQGEEQGKENCLLHYNTSEKRKRHIKTFNFIIITSQSYQ